MRRRSSTPKTKIDKDYNRQICKQRISTLMELRIQGLTRMPYTKEEIAAALFTPEQRQAIALLEREVGADVFGRVKRLYLCGPFQRIESGVAKQYRVSLVFEEPQIVSSGEWMKAEWLPQHMQQQLSEWAARRQQLIEQRNLTTMLTEGLLNVAGTYPQMMRLWPGLVSFMPKDMQRVIESTRVTRIGGDLQQRWDNIRAAAPPLRDIEQWLSEGLMLEGMEFDHVTMYTT